MSDDIDEEAEEVAEGGEPDDDFEAEPDEDEVLEPELEEDLELEEPIDDFVEVVATAEGEAVEPEEEAEEEESAPRARKVDDDEEEDDETDPDDIEADLEAILRDRMAAADDDDDEEGDEAPGAAKPDSPSGARNDEFVCESCFLLVNRSQFGSAKDPRCPMGDTECPSITKIFG